MAEDFRDAYTHWFYNFDRKAAGGPSAALKVWQSIRNARGEIPAQTGGREKTGRAGKANVFEVGGEVRAIAPQTEKAVEDYVKREGLQALTADEEIRDVADV